MNTRLALDLSVPFAWLQLEGNKLCFTLESSTVNQKLEECPNQQVNSSFPSLCTEISVMTHIRRQTSRPPRAISSFLKPTLRPSSTLFLQHLFRFFTLTLEQTCTTLGIPMAESRCPNGT